MSAEIQELMWFNISHAYIHLEDKHFQYKKIISTRILLCSDTQSLFYNLSHNPKYPSFTGSLSIFIYLSYTLAIDFIYNQRPLASKTPYSIS